MKSNLHKVGSQESTGSLLFEDQRQQPLLVNCTSGAESSICKLLQGWSS